MFSSHICSDLWRVVANYTKDHIDAYYTDATVASSGVQRYHWENLLLNETRHLEFSGERHKILETELKQLCEYSHLFESHFTRMMHRHRSAMFLFQTLQLLVPGSTYLLPRQMPTRVVPCSITSESDALLTMQIKARQKGCQM